MSKLHHIFVLVLVLGLSMAAAPSARAQLPDGELALDEVFDQPFVFLLLGDTMTRALQLGRAGQVRQMEAMMSEVVRRVPDHPVGRYNLACAKARLGKSDEALDHLAKAVSLGLAAPGQIAADRDFASLRELPRFQEIVDQAETADPFALQLPEPVPLKASKGVAMVQESNTGWNPRDGLLISLFELDEAPRRAKQAVKGNGPARERVRQWVEEGTAAGNAGDLYDNRDSDHSNLRYQDFPLLTRVEYSAAAKKRKLHWGTQTWFLYNAITIGNASVAATGNEHWSSMARLAYVNPLSMAVLHAQYRRNHLYLYPEHKDHDPGHNGKGGGYGDVFCANTPYTVITQGSSGSDKPFLDALTLTLAAFRPEVKTRLAEEGLLMSTLQMILRRCSKSTRTAKDYLTGVAHPTVFQGNHLDPMRMVTLAHAITEDALPPLAAIQVVEEDVARPNVDFFHHSPSEALFTTPHAIARVVRSTKYERRMVVTAEPSLDANGLPLTYHWRVLRGDADRIRIKPLNPDGSTVELVISYHPRFPVRTGSKLESNRVDIGAFVHNGTHYSAPAFISLFYLDNEQRTYDEAGRIQSVQYSGGSTPGNYVDPRIDTPKDWRDDYHYDDGALAGWTRTLADGQQLEFTPNGQMVVERGANGKPVETRMTVYVAASDESGRRRLAQATLDKRRPVGPRVENLRSP